MKNNFCLPPPSYQQFVRKSLVKRSYSPYVICLVTLTTSIVAIIHNIYDIIHNIYDFQV